MTTLRAIASRVARVFPAVWIPCAVAQVRPSMPLNAQSVRECNAFIAAYKDYLEGLRKDYQACMKESSYVALSVWRREFACTPVKVDVPPACVTPSDKWNCEKRMKFGKLINQCLAKAQPE